jgi:hypothetical protein
LAVVEQEVRQKMAMEQTEEILRLAPLRPTAVAVLDITLQMV